MKTTKKPNDKVLEILNNLENLLKKKDDKPLSFKETCAYLGFSPSYLYKLTSKGIIPHFKPTGKMLFFSKCELDTWIFQNGRREKANMKSEDEEKEEDAEADGQASHKETD